MVVYPLDLCTSVAERPKRLNDALSKEKSIESFGIKKEKEKKKKKRKSQFFRDIYLTLFYLFLFNRVTRCHSPSQLFGADGIPAWTFCKTEGDAL